MPLDRTLSTALVVLALVGLTLAGATVTTADRSLQEATPDIEVEPESLLFSDGADGAETQRVTIRNVGNGSLTVQGIVLVGPDRDSFTVGTDGAGPIAPGESRDVEVTFDAPDTAPRFATMHILSDDPDEPQRNVWLTNTRTDAAVSPSRVLEEKTLVNATVEDPTVNTTLSLNVSWPLTRDDGLAVDALSFVPEREGNVSLSIATNASRFETVPAFSRSDGTESAGFVRIQHSIANEDVRNVTLRLRVRKDRLPGPETGPEDVALYRHQHGTWTELPTRLVAESSTHFFFEASSPGLSDFAAGVKQAKFRITDAVVTVTQIRTHEGTEVLVRVQNEGGADGTYLVELLLDERVVDGRELSIAPNGTRQATFEQSFDEPGTYEIFVNERFVGNVTVEPTEAAGTGTTGGTGGDTDTAGESPTAGALPGLGIPAAVAALVIGALLLGRDRE